VTILAAFHPPSSIAVTYPRWIYFLDVQFTLMIFGVSKLLPIISVHGFNFLSTHINVIVPIVQKYSRLFQMFAFLIVALFIFIYFIDCHYSCESLSIIICWSNDKSIFMDNESMVFICWIFCKYY